MENQLHIALGTNKFFEGLSISDFDLTSFKGNLFTIKEGEILYREGEPFKHIYFVISGELNLLSQHIFGDSNSIIISANDFLGQDEYLNQSSRLSTVVALRDSYIIGFDSSEIKSLIGQDGRILIKLKDSRYLNLEGSNLQVNSENSESQENFGEQDLEQNIDEEIESKAQHSAILNDDVDAAMIVEPENFESPDDYEEQQDNFDIDNLKSDSEQKVEPTDDDINEFKLLEENDEEKVSTEPLGESMPVEELISEKDDLYLNGISSEEELRKIDELIQAEEKQPETNDDEEFSLPSENQDENVIPPQTEKDNIVHEEVVHESNISTAEINNEQKNANADDDNNLEWLSEEKTDAVSESIAEADNSNQKDVNKKDVSFVKSEVSDSNEIDVTKTNIITGKETNENVPTEQSESTENNVSLTEEIKTNEKHALSTDKLDMIIKAAELVNSNIKVQDVLANIVTVAADLVNADRGTLYLVEEEKGKLWSEVAMGDELKEIHLTIGEGIAGTVAQTGETINIPDASADERFESSFDKSSGYTTKSILCLPIRNKENVIVGVLQLLNSENGKFSELDEELLNALSIFIALALENANLVEQLLKIERIDSLGKMTNFLIQDIKKPVLVSKRYADHLLGKELNPDFRQVLEMMNDQLNHVADLVQTTSSYSQGHSILRAIPQSINNTLTEFSNRLDPYLRTSNCSFVTEFDKDVVVKIDSKEFYQCFYQIVRNAVEAMPDGGNLSVKTVAKETEVLISFIDNGLGINESLLDKIFEPFMTYGKKNGTGLGLSITQKVIEDHGGSISVVSTLGEGAIFTITLPLANAV